MLKKILLDTDIGCDIDDSLALAYLIKEPKCKIMGITTVSGEGEKRAALCDAMCRNIGVTDIPIYPGAEAPLWGRNRQPRAHHASCLDKWEHRTDFEKNQAVEFMRKTIRENPGEISLVAIGPLTNIAILFLIDPEIPSLLKELVLMCGDFLREGATAEWNAVVDVLATAIVYNTKVPVHRSIGLNVTTQVKTNKAQMEEMFSAKVLDPIKDFAELWFEKKEFMIYHDPLAVMTLFDDKICGFRKCGAKVVFPDNKDAGKILVDLDKSDIEIADTVDAEYALERYFKIVNS